MADHDQPPLQIISVALAPRFLDVRTRLPAGALGARPDVTLEHHELNYRLMAPQPGAARIMIVQRSAPADMAGWLNATSVAMARGWLVVSEYDDHPELIASVLKWPPERERWLQISGAHAVQTSTEPLAAAFRAHNPDVAVFPNAAFALPPLHRREDGPPGIFYGALNRGVLGVEIATRLAPAIAAFPEATFDVAFDRGFFDALPTDRKRFHGALAYEDYLAAMGRADIALLPLAGGHWEMFKSDVKYVEAGSRGAAVIASPAVYRDSVRDGETGLIAATPDDWAPALGRLLGDSGLRHRLAEAAWRDIRDHRLFVDQADRRVDWYRALWADRARLHQRLIHRHPEIGQAVR